MTYAEKAIDRSPFIPGAGVISVSAKEGEDADHSIRQDLYFSPQTKTPDRIKKYRDSLRQRIGVKFIHPGVYDDPKDYELMVHGIKTQSSEHVPDLIRGKNINGVNYFINQLNEQIYDSSKREPLGRSIVRNYKFPDEVKKNSFRFGVPTSGLCNAKDIIYNNGCVLNDTEDAKKLYYKSHGVTDPGQQMIRSYKWKFDPNTHKFGLPKEIENDGVKKSLMHDNLNSPFPQTKLIEKRLEDFRQSTEKLLGKGRFGGALPAKFFNISHTFGKESQLGDAWNAGRLIHGDETTVTKETLSPDRDLGRSWKYGSRLKNLQPIERNPNFRYGVPSIRRDLGARRKIKSMGDLRNFGDEPDAYDLLYPHPEAFRGIEDKDFENLLTKEEIQSLMKKYDFNIPKDQYDLMFEIGLKNYPNDEGKMSPKSFISTLRNLKREYQKYRVLDKDE